MARITPQTRAQARVGVGGHEGTATSAWHARSHRCGELAEVGTAVSEWHRLHELLEAVEGPVATPCDALQLVHHLCRRRRAVVESMTTTAAVGVEDVARWLQVWHLLRRRS